VVFAVVVAFLICHSERRERMTSQKSKNNNKNNPAFDIAFFSAYISPIG
jgi:hypothetical protein